MTALREFIAGLAGSLREQPLMMLMIVLNGLALAIAYLFLVKVTEGIQHRDAQLLTIIDRCLSGRQDFGR